MEVTANPTAFIALLAWPLIVFLSYRRADLATATIIAILGGYLLLPPVVGIKFQMIPNLDKNSIPSLAALLCCLLIGLPKRGGRKFGVPDIFMAAFITTPFVTSLLNNDELVFGARIIPALGAYEGGSAVLAQIIELIPFMLARRIFDNDLKLKKIILALAFCGLIYSMPALLEIRLSPQLNSWIYGFFPHMFGQQIRDGGFRPVIFLGHGLLVAFFFMMSVVSAAALSRFGEKIAKVPAWLAALFLSVILVLCKTLSAVAYAVLLIPLVRWCRPRLGAKVAIFIVLISVTYPVLRILDVFPTALFLEAAESIHSERAGSLETRFVWEARLLERASERLWFGWGRYGRSRIYDSNGYDITLSDGYWVISLGQYGIIGFLAEFGLLGLCVFRAASLISRSSQVASPETVMLATVTLIVAVNIVDLLPNSSIRPWTWLMAGALLGRAEAGLLSSPRRHRADAVFLNSGSSKGSAGAERTAAGDR